MPHRSNSNSATKECDVVRDKVEETVETAKGMASDVLDSAKKMGAQARDAMQHRWEDLRSSAGEYAQQGRKKAVELEHVVEERIQERPIASLLIAAGAGFLIGFLMRRR